MLVFGPDADGVAPDRPSLDVGARHACVLRAGGHVVCWGSDVLGQVSGTANGVRRCARPIKFR